MKLGLIGGGFKPFTSGHFTLLATAMANSDKVILYYGLAGRKKGSGYNYSREMSQEVFNIMKAAIERTYSGRVFVELGKPTPIVKIFQAISAVKDSEDSNAALSPAGIDPAQVETISVFSGPEDLDKYTKYFGTDKEERYYGDLNQTGRLSFVPVESADGEGDLSAILDIVRDSYPDLSDEEMTDRVKMRGSVFRSLIASRDGAKISQYLPPFLTNEEKAQIVEILFQGLTENVFRSYVQQILKSSR